MTTTADSLQDVDLRVELDLVDSVVAERDFGAFARYAWGALGIRQPIAWSWHLDAISEHLEAVARGEITRLVVNVPPRSTKSSLVSVLFPAWCWLRDSGMQFLTGSHSIALATRDAVATRRLVESPWFACRYAGRVVFTSDQNTKTRYDVRGGGTRIVFGVGSGITGEGGDVILLDDPIAAKDGMWSDVARQRCIDAFDHEISTRLNNPASSAIVVVMQRLHTNDLSGHLLKQGGWEHLRLPMEFEASTPCRTSLAPKQVRNGHELTHLWDKRTVDGELLQPSRFDAAYVERVKQSLGPYGYAGQMQQRPTPVGGAVVREEWLDRWTDKPRVDVKRRSTQMVFESWDLTFKRTESGSYVCGQLWLVDWPKCYLIDQRRDRLDFVQTLAVIREATATWSADGYAPSAVLVEEKANGAAVCSVLQKELRGVIPRGVEGGDKVARLHAHTPAFASHCVVIPADGLTPWVRQYVDEMLSFPLGDHDDQVDATTQALAYAAEIFGKNGRARSLDATVLDFGGRSNPWSVD